MVRYGTFSPGIKDIAALPVFLQGEIRYRPAAGEARSLRAMLTWGRKHPRSAINANAYANSHGVPMLYLEDGFLRSVGLGSNDPPLSLVVDDLGIYYDAASPSRLEQLIAAERGQDEIMRARRLMHAWKQARVSKYNHARELAEPLERPYILVIDQTRGDASIHYGQGTHASFARMLEAALDEHPKCTIILKTHPEVFAGRKEGHYDRVTAGQASRVRVLGEDIHPASLFEHARAVYTVTSQIGFEAALWGRPVRVFGMPFYAGWSITNDDMVAPDRRKPVPLENLILGTLVDYPRYYHPETQTLAKPEQLIDYLSFQRRMRARYPKQVHAVGFSRWQRPIAKAFFQGTQVVFHAKTATLPGEATVALWGQPPEGLDITGKQFVRLRESLLPHCTPNTQQDMPCALDMYAEYPTDVTATGQCINQCLVRAEIDKPLIKRARLFRKRMLEAQLTLHPRENHDWLPPSDRKPIILVPGEIGRHENDANLVKRLRHYRDNHANAYLIYLDTRSQTTRQDTGRDRQVKRLCDIELDGIDLIRVLPRVDEVHVRTSLVGLDAMLRGRKVVAYAPAFYAGWGLTIDRIPVPDRPRALSLDELVAALYLAHPAYISRVTGKFTSPEQALAEIIESQQNTSGGFTPIIEALRKFLPK
jgi:capsular polysaccharide export protein